MHHTKDKGDLAVFKAQVSLCEQGYVVCTPQTEHAPFDLVAYKGGEFLRVQVKYRAAVNGRVALMLASSWADRSGSHHKPYDKADIDVWCVFCPDTDRCYYVRSSDVDGVSLTLLLNPPRNNQQQGIRMAVDFERVP